MARYSVASTQIAIGFELTVISACVVGGISVMGGVGTVLGCVLGALLIGLIRNALPAVDISQVLAIGDLWCNYLDCYYH